MRWLGALFLSKVALAAVGFIGVSLRDGGFLGVGEGRRGILQR